MRTPIALATAVTALALAGPAAASGGVNSGGVNSGGVNSGGGTVVSSAPSSAATQISSFSASAGYRPGGFDVGAVWVTFAVKNASQTNPSDVLISLTEQNLTTGQIEWGWTDQPVTIDANKTYAPGTYDNDWTPLATSYLVTLTVKDATTGAVVDTRSATVTTGKLRTS